MTLEKLNQLCKKHEIPADVHLLSDSGWECGETEMDGPYYNKERNIIVFTQEHCNYSEYDPDFDTKLGKSRAFQTDGFIRLE